MNVKSLIKWHLNEIVIKMKASGNPDIMTALGEAVISFGGDFFKVATYDVLRAAADPLTIRAWNKDKTLAEAVALVESAHTFVDNYAPASQMPVLKVTS